MSNHRDSSNHEHLLLAMVIFDWPKVKHETTDPVGWGFGWEAQLLAPPKSDGEPSSVNRSGYRDLTVTASKGII